MLYMYIPYLKYICFFFFLNGSLGHTELRDFLTICVSNPRIFSALLV